MAGPLRFLQLNKYYWPHIGGVETVAQQLAEALNGQTEMRVLVCANGRRASREKVNGVDVQRCGSAFIAGAMPVSFSYLRQVRKAAKTADVLLLHMPFPWGDLALLFSGYKGRVLLWWHSDIVRQKKLLRLYKPLLLRTLRRADVILAATQGHIDGSDFLPAFRDKCVVVPYGVDEDIFKAGGEYLAAGEPAPKNSDEPVRFLFIGRLVYYKGCEVLLRAFAALNTPGCTLSLVGEGPLQAELEQLAKTLGVGDRVHFLGRQTAEGIRRALAGCDVFVLSSVAKSEAFGLVQLEAMAYAKPVINTNLPSGVPWVSPDGETGLTVEPGDAEGLAAAMDKLAADPALRRQYGMAGRARVEKDYRIGTMAGRVLEVAQDGR